MDRAWGKWVAREFGRAMQEVMFSVANACSMSVQNPDLCGGFGEWLLFHASSCQCLLGQFTNLEIDGAETLGSYSVNVSTSEILLDLPSSSIEYTIKDICGPSTLVP